MKLENLIRIVVFKALHDQFYCLRNGQPHMSVRHQLVPARRYKAGFTIFWDLLYYQQYLTFRTNTLCVLDIQIKYIFDKINEHVKCQTEKMIHMCISTIFNRWALSVFCDQTSHSLPFNSTGVLISPNRWWPPW